MNRESGLITISSTALKATALVPEQPCLVVVWPRELACRIMLDAELITVGRSSQGAGSIALNHATVSRRHVHLSKRERGFWVKDLGSRNGSWLDGQSLAGRDGGLLGEQSVLTVGDVILVYETLPRGSAPPSELLFGESAAMLRLRGLAEQVARDAAPALILGETGSGKEALAMQIHRQSERPGAFVPLSCAELTPELTDSQLFGHEKGAFTGAEKKEEGLFRAAHEGTLFLDEIGELSLEAQPKLLRAVQEREVRPVGATRAVKVDVRVLAATHVDLAAAVEAGRFRRDLYARLALFELHLPPLRQRRADLVRWIDRLTARWATERGRPVELPAFEAGALERMLLDPWPENLRGLDAFVHRWALTWKEKGPVTKADLAQLMVSRRAEAAPAPAGEKRPPRGERPAPPATREELEQVLAAHGGSVRAVAAHYQRERRQIYRWLDAFGLRREGE